MAPTTVMLLSLLSSRSSFRQGRDVKFQPRIHDTHSTVNRGQQQGDERKAQFPGGQRKYKFTEDFQRHLGNGYKNTIRELAVLCVFCTESLKDLIVT